MKIISLFIFVFLTIFSYGSDWHDNWTNAVQYCELSKYEDAENEFNLAINNLEKNNDIEHPYVYVDRARLYLLLSRYQEALVDLNKAIESKYLTANDKTRGLVTRIMVCSNLQMEEQVLADFDSFKALSPNFPKVEFTKEKVIIRNVPKSKCYKNLAKAFLLGSQICKKESDIIEYSSGIMIARRSICNCGCDKLINAAGSQQDVDQKKVDSCKYWCDKSALAGMAWCSKVFKKWDCQTSCIFAVDLIKDGCHWCCESGSFYRKCIKPVDDILQYIPSPCEPGWD
ncbi:hypothetical protein BN1013_00657 [Candidatus Rubidus massiliensis]|nr:hypothetical protein BN1013_00657 [Candidatus Rubidus massiliensis]